jgi:RNA polymerase sigma factor (TIGR02999 family)
MPKAGEVTQLLVAMQSGNKEAESRLLELVYDELRRIASRYLRRERQGHTLQATELANEAYMRLVPGPPAGWNSRSHFYAVAAQVMRRILVDYARARNAGKRGQGNRVDIEGVTLSVDSNPEEIILLDLALTKLSELDPRRSRVVEMRVFGGLTEKEIADVLGVAERTVKRDWSLARAWLWGEVGGPTRQTVSQT